MTEEFGEVPGTGRCRVVPIAGLMPMRWRIEQKEDDYRAYREIGYIEYPKGAEGWTVLNESLNEVGSAATVRAACVMLVERQENEAGR